MNIIFMRRSLSTPIRYTIAILSSSSEMCATRMISPHQTIESIDPYWHTLTCLVGWHHLIHVLLFLLFIASPSRRCIGWRRCNYVLFVTLHCERHAVYDLANKYQQCVLHRHYDNEIWQNTRHSSLKFFFKDNQRIIKKYLFVKVRA